MTRTIFVVASGLVGYTYVLFPGLVLLRARLRPRPHFSAPITPPVSVIIAARNEGRAIAAKLDNVLTLGLSAGPPAGRRRCRRVRGRHRRRRPRAWRRARSRAEPAARWQGRRTQRRRRRRAGEILVFSDANSLYAPTRCERSSRHSRTRGRGVAGDQRYVADQAEAGWRPASAGTGTSTARSSARRAGAGTRLGHGGDLCGARELFRAVPPTASPTTSRPRPP